MSHQIIKQPDNLYCIWSTIVEDIIGKNLTEKDLLKYYGNLAKEEAEKKVQEILTEIKEGRKPYFQFTLTYKEALERRKWNK